MSINIKKILIYSIASIFLSQVFPVGASPRQPKPKSFFQWCQQKKNLPAATRRTIDALLNQASTTKCSVADSKLRNLTTLNLNYYNGQFDRHPVSDLKPLASLTNLTELSLFNNNITDLKPLAGLHNLTKLELEQNEVKDIQPLSELNNLTFLMLSNNKISDLTPLSGLSNLQKLYLDFNKVSKIEHLSSLSNLKELYLNFNEISDVSPLSNLSNLQYIYLQGNQINDVKPLSSFDELKGLYLSGNTFNKVACPLKPNEYHDVADDPESMSVAGYVI
jgi:internalin A